MDIYSLISLKDKVAIVTGSSKGLGKSYAETLASAGADLVVNSRHGEELKEVVDAIKGMGRKVLAVEGDLSNEKDIKMLVEKTLKEYGKIDILVNNAATERVNIPPEETSLESWNYVMNTNVNGVFLTCKEVGKVMIKQKRGKIINLASLCGSFVIKETHGGSYDVSKSAIIGLTRVLASEWAKYNITVNAIAPGFYNTPANYKYFTDNKEFAAKLLDSVPLGKFGDVEEMGGVAVFLASDVCNYMTGSIIFIDGGFSIW